MGASLPDGSRTGQIIVESRGKPRGTSRPSGPLLGRGLGSGRAAHPEPGVARLLVGLEPHAPGRLGVVGAGREVAELLQPPRRPEATDLAEQAGAVGAQ